MIFEFQGHLRNAVRPEDWERVAPAQAIRNLMTPSMFDRLEMGRRYNLQLNFAICWDEDDGLAVSSECLPCDPAIVLHNEVVPETLNTFLLDHWDALLQMPVKIIVIFCLAMCDEPIPAITLLNCRIGEAEWALRNARAVRPVTIGEGLSRGLTAW